MTDRRSAWPGRRNGMLAALLAAVALGGCESFGRGVATAVLAGDDGMTEDDRRCFVEGLPFDGLAPLLAQQADYGPLDPARHDPNRPQLKVLYVHGIGTHLPGHGAPLARGLAEALGLSVRSARHKVIPLIARDDATQPLGELRIVRTTDDARLRDMLFYELTWSVINEPAKRAIAFDKSGLYSTRRASINQSMRVIVNDLAPDPIAYAGNSGELIQEAIGQSLCWAFSRTWSELPEAQAPEVCGFDQRFGSRADKDPLAIITHSLGSRAAIDALQSIVERVQRPEFATEPHIVALRRELAERPIRLYMLSNQLPLLEAGQDPAAVRGLSAPFCTADAPRRAERFFGSTDIVAFNDPNDILSYPIPPDWVETYLDSRLCPAVTNVTINVATVRNVLGLGEVADPLAAHTQYATDERVLALIAHGAGHNAVAPVIEERCQWLPLDEALMN